MRRPTVSISCIETRDATRAIRAIERTAECIDVECLYWFGTKPYPTNFQDREVVDVYIRDFTNFFNDVNRICLRVMPRVVTTDYNLIVQSDGFAVNPDAWDDRFFNYDYIGAPWPWMWGGGPPWNGPNVGNGGFSLRSRKLYEALLDLKPSWHPKDYSSDERFARREYHIIDLRGWKFIPEDMLIAIWCRDTLESKYGIRFAPPDLASQFSVETLCEYSKPWLGRSFGFHGVMAAPHYGVTL